MEEIKKISKEDFCEKFKIILPDHAPSDTQKGVIGNLGKVDLEFVSRYDVVQCYLHKNITFSSSILLCTGDTAPPFP